MPKGVSRWVKQKYVRFAQRRRARKRPTQAEILSEFRKSLKKTEFGELAKDSEQARKLSPAQIDSLLQRAQDSYTEVALRKIIHYSLRQFGIKNSKAELTQAIEKIIARRWKKDEFGSENYKRDRTLIENFNTIYAILGKKKGNQVVGAVVKKMQGFFPVPLRGIATLGLQKEK